MNNIKEYIDKNKNDVKGYLSFILHAHLPFVRHADTDKYIEERWLYEAITETYIPLLENFDKLVNEKVDFCLTMSLTPTLISMLTDKVIQKKYIKYINNLIELSSRELIRTKDNPNLFALAKYYNDTFKHSLYVFDKKYRRNLVSAFKRFQDLGYIEIITCGATHGFLPLMETVPAAIDAQIRVGVEVYTKHLGVAPKGIWLPECGYTPIVEKYLKKYNIQYFITESHGILYSNPNPIYGLAAPLMSENGLFAFGRDIESSRQVWSSTDGYPGDFNYREYYSDIGYDLDYDYVKSVFPVENLRMNTSIKYKKVTSKDGSQKELYNIDNARATAESHADNFMFNREAQISYLSNIMKIKPIITCPYDAELYGHWWYEGPYWIYMLFKKIHYNSTSIRLITPSIYLSEVKELQVANLCQSTWGAEGYNHVWINDKNEWIYRYLINAAEKMVILSNEYIDLSNIINNIITNRTEKKKMYFKNKLLTSNNITKISNKLKLLEDIENTTKMYNKKLSIYTRALNQCSRELLLAQSSDWAFIITTDTMVEYATRRTDEHIKNFYELYEQIKNDKIKIRHLTRLEKSNNIFPDINYKIYSNGD